MVDTKDTTTNPPLGDEPGETPGIGTGRIGGIDIQGMLGQLQGMISKVAAASEPALREVAAKAAELAAVAAERAGPIAHTIADKTDQVGHSVAGKASELASSIRAGGHSESGDASGPGGATVVGDQPSVTDPAEDSPRDGA